MRYFLFLGSIFLLSLGSACSKPAFQFSHAEEQERKLPQDGFKVTPGSRLRLATRSYVSTSLKDIFGPTSVTIVDKHVTSQVAAFGGEPCDPNVGPCAVKVGESQLPMVPNAVPARLALTGRACQELVSLASTLNAAIQNARVSSQLAGTNLPTTITAPSDRDIAAAFDLFYTGKPMTEAVASDLREMLKGLADLGHGPLEQWRLLLGVLCESPGWQIP